MNLDQALQTFIIESRELLEEMENTLLELKQTQDRGEAVNAIFRAAHTIKGSAGLFGLDHIVRFTHVVESVLDVAREGHLEIGDDLVAVLLACGDHISALISAVEAGNLEDDADLSTTAEALLAQLRNYLSDPSSGPLAEVKHTEPIVEKAAGEIVENDAWHISLRFGKDVLRNGMDPTSFIRYLGELGKITGIVTHTDAIPSAAEMDPESCYLGFEIAFASDASKAAIENVFEFVQDDCSVRILPPNSLIAEYERLLKELPEENIQLGEMLVRCGSLTENELKAALARQNSNQPPLPRIGDILVEQGFVQPAVIEAAAAKQKQVKEQKASVRVDADKLDRLINLVGELITASASADLIARRAANTELHAATSILTSLVEEVRDSAMQLRMVKIGATFSRFQRVVHDVAQELGKNIVLEVNGEETELDKTVVEKIGDPLMHLVRNAMDHGIESADVRAARGKSLQGVVKLNAYHDSGSIVIEVSDDGGGLKRDKIMAKAIERGLIEPDRNLSDSEVYNLIFEPGFSTAEKVTNLSGRGVGMDVVKRNITALRGSVQVSSQEGVGTTMSVCLPLTLAIIDGFLIGLGKSAFVIPLDMMEECIEFFSEADRDYTNLRGQVLPFIRLRDLFNIEGPAPQRQNIVVVNYAGQRIGLVVDVLLGEFQAVIKPLGKIFNRVKCISGSTILGSGEIALILDVPSLVQQASQSGNLGNQSTETNALLSTQSS